MEFVCVGFDIRNYPCRDGYSADSSEWERNEDLYEEFLYNNKVSANEYGLLSIKDQAALRGISDWVLESSASSDLVALELPLEIVRFMDDKTGFHSSSNQLDLAEFVCRGFDVCDLNGFITLFNHPAIELYKNEEGLIRESKICMALEALQLANVVEPAHRPAVLVKVHTLR